VVTGAYTPHRGDIVWFDFDPQAGREQAGRRPALILSDRRYNARSQLAVLCPITSQFKPYPFFVELPKDTLTKPSYVIADQVRSLDWTKRQVSFITTVSAQTLELVTAFAVGIVQGKN
jgi:mRNA interferase MazF